MNLFRVIFAVATLLAASPATAQWQTPNYSVPIGQGIGKTGFRFAAPNTSGYVFTSNGPATDPTFQPPSGTGTGPLNAGNVWANNTASSASPPAGGVNATSWFDQAYCNTVGYLIVRTTGAWTCSQGTPANVTWWGADKTGVASSSSAISTMQASGAKHFLFPCGTYLVTSSIQPASFQTWEGEAFRCVLINQSGLATTNGIFDLTADTVQEVRITNFGVGVFANGNGLLSRGNFGVYVQNFICANTITICVNIQASVSNSYRIFLDNIEAIAAAGQINNGIQIGTPGGTTFPQGIWITNSELANAVNCGIEIFAGGGITIDKTEFLTNGGDGFCTFPSASQSVKGLFMTNLFFDTNSHNGINLSENGGVVTDVSLANVWSASNTFNGIQVATSAGHVSGVNIVGGRIVNNKQHGIFLNSGDHISIAGVQIEGNSVQSSATFDGVNLFGSQHVQITGGISGAGGFASFPATNLQRYGINIAGGGADYVLVSGMDLCTNVTGGFINSSAGTHNVIRDNPCYNPVGLSNIGVGASPFTFTNGATPTTVYMNGGSGVGNIVVNGVTIGNGNNALNPQTFELGPNESMAVSYSTTAPNMVKDVH